MGDSEVIPRLWARTINIQVNIQSFIYFIIIFFFAHECVYTNMQTTCILLWSYWVFNSALLFHWILPSELFPCHYKLCNYHFTISEAISFPWAFTHKLSFQTLMSLLSFFSGSFLNLSDLTWAVALRIAFSGWWFISLFTLGLMQMFVFSILWLRDDANRKGDLGSGLPSVGVSPAGAATPGEPWNSDLPMDASGLRVILAVHIF